MRRSSTPRAEPPALPPRLDRQVAASGELESRNAESGWRTRLDHGDTWIVALLIAAILCLLFFMAMLILSVTSSSGSGTQSNSGSQQGTQEGVLDSEGDPGNTLEDGSPADAMRAAGEKPGATVGQEDATENDVAGKDRDTPAESQQDSPLESEADNDGDASSVNQAMLSRVENRQPLPGQPSKAQSGPSPIGGAAGSDLATNGGINPFLGDGPPAKSTVFVIDVSGSMQMPDRLPRVVKALSRAIDQLKPNQKFCVLLFDDFYYANPNVQLMAATTQNKEDMNRWLGQPVGGGGTNPLPAMQAAIQLQPERIVLLSDGEFDPSSAITITELNQANKTPARIDCVGLMEQVLVLQEIAKKNQGVYYQAW